LSNQLGCVGLGVAKASGMGTEKDVDGAVELFRKACDEGEMRGCAELAAVYLNGAGSIEKDEAKAIELFRKACDANDGRGCAGMGVVLFNGQGIAADPAAAVGYFRKACEGEAKEA